MLQGWDPSWTVRRFDASAAVDASGVFRVGGVSAVLERGHTGTLTLVALGPTSEVVASTRFQGVPATCVPAGLLIPGLVNAHTHLDLTHMGPRPHDPASGFAPWIDMVRRERLSDKAEIADSVRSGIGKSLRGGSVLVGDIAGAVGGRPSPLASTALADDGRINAVTYSEFFAQGRAFRRTVRAVMEVYKALSVNLPLSSAAAVVPGISPHAPFSVNRHAYDLLTVLLIKQGCSPPISSHIAESAEEVRLIAYGDGPLAELLKSVGVWDEWTQAVIGRGETPLEHVAGGRYLPLMNACAIHCNAVTDEDMVAMLEGSISCIYCPRASAYFGAERSFGPHRYAEMLDPGWGINVALGTDSIVNLDTPSRISVWDEMAFLHRRDGTDPIKLLKMATLNGAAALRRDPAQFRFVEGGHLAGLATVLLEDTNRGGSGAELLSGALRGGHVADQGPELLAIGRV